MGSGDSCVNAQIDSKEKKHALRSIRWFEQVGK